jgi:hypothetical protein
MPLIRPRLTEFHGLGVSQASVDFAIPFLDEDLPLYVDPFLLWKSPSLQDQSLHGAMIAAFNRLGGLSKQGTGEQAVRIIQQMSECEEVGLGGAASKKGKRIGASVAQQIHDLFRTIPLYSAGFTHFEEIQLFVDGISKDRVSDIPPKAKTTSANVEAYKTLNPLLVAMYKEFQELSKKKQDGQVGKTKVKMVNRLLKSIHELLQEEPNRGYLDELNEDDLPQNSDVVLILSQTAAAMDAFHKRYYVGLGINKSWST